MLKRRDFLRTAGAATPSRATSPQTGMFEAGDCVQVDHDPDTSQLGVLGCSPFDACRQAKNGHFEVLLHSTVFHISRKP